MPNRPLITLLVGSERQYLRDVLRGFARYAWQHAEWLLESEPTQQHAAALESAVARSAGVVLFLRHRHELELLQASDKPFITLSRLFPEAGAPCVINDAAAIGRVAFEHFLERGFRHFAYCELDEHSHLRREPFARAVAQAGFTCHAFEVPYGRRGRWASGEDHEELAAWIKDLPKPIGILAHNDLRGRHVSNACRRLEISVPDEVAVLGVDNETPHCDLSNPPLSSVATDGPRSGYEAARLLHQLLDGQTPDKRLVEVPPTGVVVRQSTDVQATQDAIVSRAVKYIRLHAHRGIRVGDVLAHVVVSRTSLDKRFQAALGHSPHEEIVRVRLQRAQLMLRETTLTLEQIAERTGFRHGEYLGVVFQRYFRQTPGEYRAAAGER